MRQHATLGTLAIQPAPNALTYTEWIGSGSPGIRQGRGLVKPTGSVPCLRFSQLCPLQRVDFTFAEERYTRKARKCVGHPPADSPSLSPGQSEVTSLLVNRSLGEMAEVSLSRPSRERGHSPASAAAAL